MSTIEIRPLAGCMGAEIYGVDAGNMSEEDWQQVHDAYLKYIAIFLPDQKLTPTQFQAWGERFGPLMIHPYLKPLNGEGPVHELYKGPNDKGTFGSIWHSDFPFVENIPRAVCLYARTVPEYGGDTMFANRYLAYETLPDPYKKLLEDMEAVFKVNSRYEGNVQLLRNTVGKKVDGGAVHRVIQTHPITGRKNLHICPLFMRHFVGMSEEDSRPLIDYLSRHATRPEFTARIRWRRDTLGIWDNWASLHFAINDYSGMERHMHRLVVN
jgi:taurine dioxygenase